MDQLISDREPESLFLDFKRSPDNGAARNLAPEDNKNLSKAISGFANSSGGVIVWGVDCRRDGTGNEVATKYPLQDAGGFNTKLQAAVSRTTIPAHPGVQVLFFEEPDQSPLGYVVVYVPQSQIGPIRSLNSNHYHVRTGSDFSVLPHDVLAGMFGRHPQPSIDINFVSYPVRVGDRPGCLTIAVGCVAVNLGAVVGERPYLSGFTGDFPHDFLTIQAPDPRSFLVRHGLLPSFGVVATEGFLLPPGATEHMCDVVLSVPISQPRAIKLECTLGVLRAPPKRFTLEASEAEVRAGISRADTDGERFPSMELLRLLPGT